TLACASAVLGAAKAGVSLSGWPLLAIYPPLAMLALWARGLYRRRLNVSIVDSAAPLVGALSAVAMTLIAGVVLLSRNLNDADLVARAWLFSLAYVMGVRTMLVLVQRSARMLRGGCARARSTACAPPASSTPTRPTLSPSPSARSPCSGIRAISSAPFTRRVRAT